VRESEEEAWSDGGGVWMAADMIWGGRGRVALAREGEGNSIYNYHPITHLGNLRLDNPFYYLIRVSQI